MNFGLRLKLLDEKKTQEPTYREQFYVTRNFNVDLSPEFTELRRL